ncbi:MAG TPA: immunoglobulin domain-containing protein, partial [Saprospiraceae bacterium]|nr:immunoglobulin domain-containing protein [Saprospiraceae bacterium]
SATSDIPLPVANWAWFGPPADSWKVFQNPNPTRNPAVGGLYKVVGKTSFGCADSAFVNVTVIDPPVITSVTNTAPICADGSDAVLQVVAVSQNGPLNYYWTPPGGGLLVGPMPVITNVTPANNGTYMVTVYDKYGCSSEVGSTVIDVDSLPARPVLSVTPPVVCAGSDVTISITNTGNYSNPIFTWFSPNNGDTATTQPFIIIHNAQAQDAGNHFVIVASPNGCVSDSSLPANVIVNPVPPIPVVTANSTILCTGDTLKLSAQSIFGATYAWTGPPGTVFTPSPNVRNPVVQNVTPNSSGNYSVTITLNGCSSSGEGLAIQVKARPKQPIIKTPVPAACLDQQGSVMILQITDSSQVPGAQYTWYHAPTQSVVSGPGFPISYQASVFTGFNPGLNGFYVIGNKDGCNSLVSNTVEVQFDTIPDNVNPGAGMDGAACATGSIQLNADNPAPATGQWTQLTNFPGVFSSAGDPMARVNGIVPLVTYQFVWTLSNGGCKNFAADTVSIETDTLEQALVQVQQIDTCYAKSVRLHAIQGETVNGYWSQIGQPGLGIYFHDSNDPNTIVDSLPPGNIYYFNWNLDNGACG